MDLPQHDRAKASKLKVLIKKLKDKRIHDNLILLRLTFPIIVLESLRRIARWVVFADITFVKLANTTPSRDTHYSRDTPHLWGSGMHDRQSQTVHALPGPLAIRSYTSHAFEGIPFRSTLHHSTVLHATCLPTTGS